MAGAASALMGFFQMGGGLLGGVLAAVIGDPVHAFAILLPALGIVSTVCFLLWQRLPEPSRAAVAK